ncbi:HU family DNA-binding protein [Streptomyces sp. NPDC000927]|uniref:HU family DNA-binding protein n=1 Tax=Streptomyces sp. NPDC000927 TaxID=3154371 RepID=UPI0033211567
MTQQAQINGPLTKTTLGEAVAAELGVRPKEGHAAVNAVLGVIARAVTSGYKVNVTNFGTWLAVERPERTARDMFNGRTVIVPPHRGVTFRVAPRFKEIVRGGDPNMGIEKASRAA